MVLSIEHFNFDCVKDTLVGKWVGVNNYLPVRIQWGRDYRTGRENCTPQRKNTDEPTLINYPDWRNLTGSSTVLRMNSDTLADIMIFIWGQTGDSATPRDTGMGIVIFGQTKLPKLSRMEIGQKSRLKFDSYNSLRLAEGEDMVERKVRDFSGKHSFELLPGKTSDEDRQSDEIPVVSAVEEPWVRVFPNPAIYSTNVTIRRIPPGDYRVVVVSVNGQHEIEKQVTVPTSGEVLSTIDLSQLASGYYLVQIHKKNRLISSYPIAIVH